MKNERGGPKRRLRETGRGPRGEFPSGSDRGVNESTAVKIREGKSLAPASARHLVRAFAMLSSTVFPERSLPAFTVTWTLIPLLLLGLYPPRIEAFVDGAPPGISGDDPYVKRGFLPVTLYGAGPDDDEDDTAAIQKAVDDAVKYGFVAFFPAGRYTVSDTIRAMQPTSWDQIKKKWIHDRNRPNALVGSTRGDRPRLVLADGAEGFNDPKRPKPLVWIWAQPRNNKASGAKRNLGSLNPEDEQPNISMDQVFKGIDIDLRARDNRGAVGIRHAGSQGSTLEDVDIWAEGAYAGILNAPGQGGGVYRVKIFGGDYGVWANHRTRFPIFAGLRLVGQEKAAILWSGQSNLTLAGFYLEAFGNGPVITLTGGKKPIRGALTLIDGVIKVRGGLAIDNAKGRNLYLNNVSVFGAGELLHSAGRDPVEPRAAWSRVVEYAYAGRESAIVLNGQVKPAGSELLRLDVAGEPDPDAMESQHVWGEEFPSFEDPDVVDVSDFGAAGDGGTDDTDAIERALSSSKKVFLPRGTYLVSRTLTIPKDTHLLGAAKHLSIIRASEGWNPQAGTPIVSTADDPTSRSSLSFLRIESGIEQRHTALEWRAGRGSIVRDIMVDLSPPVKRKARTRRPWYADAAKRRNTYRIKGGGRWYGIAAPWNKMRFISKSPDYRHLLIEGSKEPLAIYGLNVERSLSHPQSEIRNAENVKIYYLKGETLRNENNGVLSIVDSRNIAVFGYSGIASPLGNAIVSIRESEGLLLANLAPLRQDSGYSTLLEERGGRKQRISGTRAVVLFRRNGGEAGSSPARAD